MYKFMKRRRKYKGRSWDFQTLIAINGKIEFLYPALVKTQTLKIKLRLDADILGSF